MLYLYLVLLVLLNLLWLFLVILGVPGNWLMILGAILLDWWLEEPRLFAWGTIAAVTGMAVLGEVAELISGMVGSRRAGGSRRGAAGALLGAFAGGLVGTAFFPVLGTLLGVCAGAFAGAFLLESTGGRTFHESTRSGMGAAAGHLFGVTTKLILGVGIWTVLAVAAFV